MFLEAWGPLGWEPQRTALTSLANVWLAEGATSVTISIDGVPLVDLSADKALSADRVLTADGRPLDVVNKQGAGRQPPLVAPIHWEGQQAGEIRVMGIAGQGAFGKAAQARVAAEAELVGLLLETSADLTSMTDQLIQTQDQLLAVYDLGQLARRPMRLSERLLALAEAAGRLLNVEGTAIVLASDDKPPVAAQYPPGAQDEEWLLTLLSLLPSPQGPAADGASPRRSLLWQGRQRGDGRPPSLPDQVASLLIVPIRAPQGRGRPVQGAFVFWSAQYERFASPDKKLAHAIAEHACVQIENALLQRDLIAQARFETEMQLARRVQNDLLPKTLPRLPGLDLYARTRPASHVGGDFFDFVADSADSTVFLVSDVSGKGMSAALVMTMTRTIVRSVLGQAKKAAAGSESRPRANSPRPASLLALVNDELYKDLTELSMFVTAFVAQYHHSSRRLLYANAGHSPVIYMPAGSRPELLEAGCPPIGVLPALEYAPPLVNGSRILTFGPGDLLVAASDGFNEARNPAGQMFGLERLLRCVEENGHLPVEAVGETLFAAVEAFRDGEVQEDDQTLVIAKGA